MVLNKVNIFGRHFLQVAKVHKRFFTVSFIGHFKSVKTCMLPVQRYARNRRGLGEISQERSLEGGVLLGRELLLQNSLKLLRTGSTSLLLFRGYGKAGLTTWLTCMS